ncbi:MAG TPA: hypothetical protein VGD30_07745 [Telluria sp.]
MSHVRTQTTLSASYDLEERLHALDLGRVAAWHAFELATTVPVPVSTGSGLSQHLFDELVASGVMREAHAGERLTRRALYEPFAWTYPRDVGHAPALQAQLLRHFRAEVARDGAQSALTEMWRRLADAEVRTYLGHLLRKHALDPTDADTVVQAIADEWMLHPLGRKRYLVWNAVRGAAAALLKSNLDQAVARQTLIEELRRRSRWLLLQEEARTLSASDYCFAPALGWRTPLLVRVLQEHWLAEPAAYWALRPPTPE